MRKFTADFETTTDVSDCRVWAYAIAEVGNSKYFEYGNSIEGFMNWCKKNTNTKVYFHNLKFDIQFILSYLMNQMGFVWVKEKKEAVDGSFTTLITDTGQFYQLVIYFKVNKKNHRKVVIQDSMKIFPNFSVENIAKAFNLPMKKLKIDYKAKREIGHQLTKQEINYIEADVKIVALALNEMFNRNLKKMTIASNAMEDFKDKLPHFRRKFPVIDKEVDKEIRKSYRGGFTYVNDVWKEKQTPSGMTLDVNSLYPSTLINFPMPYGRPVKFEGQYQKDVTHPLYVQTLSCTFKLKKGKIPTIQIKNTMSFIANEYLKSSKGEMVTLTLTSVDLELFFKHYEVVVIKWKGGYKFKQCKGLFEPYINYWMNMKVQAGKDGNAPLKAIAKLMLNSLYGRFALSLTAGQKYPVLDSNGVVHFKLLPVEEREGLYIPVGCFVTAYGRKITLETSQIIKDYSKKKYKKDLYFYSDTDSIHTGIKDEDLEALKDIIKIDEFAIGCWAKENEFKKAMFIRQKCYIEQGMNGKLDVVVAGMPKYLAPLINFKNFKRGFSTSGMGIKDMIKLASKNGATEEEIEKLHPKLTYKYVKGGVVLVDTDYTIKD